jgi:hypothetical protein
VTGVALAGTSLPPLAPSFGRPETVKLGGMRSPVPAKPRASRSWRGLKLCLDPAAQKPRLFKVLPEAGGAATLTWVLAPGTCARPPRSQRLSVLLASRTPY